MTDNTQGSAASRYAQLISGREHFTRRGDKAASLTLPTLFMKDKNPSDGGDIPDPAQSLGARGVNNLGSKLTLSILPMNTPFYKLNVGSLEMKRKGEGELETEVKESLGAIERGVLETIENTGDVTAVYEILKHLIVVGNCLAFVAEDGTRLFDLNKYVTVRDPQGNPLEVLTCEKMAVTSLDADALSCLTSPEAPAMASNLKTVDVYTHVTFKDGRVKWHQEIEGQVVPNSQSDVPEEGNPWMPLRFIRVDGEAYGRGYVEMYMGDLESLEVLTKAVRDAAVSAAKVIWLVKPHGTTSAKTIATAENNSVKTGDAAEVTALRLDKAADLRIAENMIRQIESRLAFAFMLNSEVLRDAERVTAEEVRFVAQELDDSLGGIYSLLSKEFQLPYVKRRMFLMRKAGDIPKLPDSVKPVIVTGFAALGRGHDREKLMRYIQTIVEAVGKEGLPTYVNIDELITRLAIADGIDVMGLLITPEERDAKQKAAMQQQMAQQATPEILKQAGGMMQQQMAQASPQPPTP